MDDGSRPLLLWLGQAQIDAMFARQEAGPVIDDSEFLPLVEAVLTAFETAHADTTTSRGTAWPASPDQSLEITLVKKHGKHDEQTSRSLVETGS
jgi:hypothetical protein